MDTANTQAASANIRLRWNYRPDSDVYVIYTAGQRFASLVAANPAQFYETASPSNSRIPVGRKVNMKWITRKNIKVDRVPCPWLIQRFDPQAEFLFVEEKEPPGR